VGKSAIKFVEEACRALGVQALHLEVGRDNPRAQALYRRVGFEDHDRYLMTKWISP
jgi:ribosomal protein S18 acetylase RimI-like enzyme